MPLTQYAAIDREAIWAGLFAWLLAQIGSQFKSMGRKHTMPPDLVPADQPALFQVALKEIHIPSKPPGAPSKIQLKGALIVYSFDASPVEDIGQEEMLEETVLNGLLMAIDGAFVPDNFSTGKFTIGGLVTHCWIEGDTDIDPGIVGPQAAAILPVNILV